MKKTISIKRMVCSLFILTTLLIGGLTLGLEYYFSCQLVDKTAEDYFLTTAENVGERTASHDRLARELVDILRNFDVLEKMPVPGSPHPALPALVSAMEQNPDLSAIHVGYDDGGYYDVINLDEAPQVRKIYQARPEDRWMVVKIIPGPDVLKKYTKFLDKNYKSRAIKESVTTYDPRKRNWYKAALRSGTVQESLPYLFANIKSPGTTYSGRIRNSRHVVAADLTRSKANKFLEEQRFLPSCEIFVFDPKGEISFCSRPDPLPSIKPSPDKLPLSVAEQAYIESHPVIRVSNEMNWPPFDFAPGGRPEGYSIDILKRIAGQAGLSMEFVNGYSWTDLESMFNAGEIDLMHSLSRTPEREKAGLFSDPYAEMALAAATVKGRPPVTRLEQLNKKTVAITVGWSTIEYIEHHFPQIRIIPTQTFLEALMLVKEGKVDATIEIRPILQYLKKAYFMEAVVIGQPVKQLSSEGLSRLQFLVRKENPVLLGILNKGLAAITKDEKKLISARWGMNQPMLSGLDMISVNMLPYKELLEMAASQKEGNYRTIKTDQGTFFAFVQSLDGLENQFIGILVSRAEILAPYLKRLRFSIYAVLGCMVLFIPMIFFVSSAMISPIKALVMENQKVKKREWKAVGLVSSRIKEIMDLSRSMKEMASAIQGHEIAQDRFMDALIKLIASTIDEKSPYTGKHCERVPKIALMLARAAQESELPTLADFSFKTGKEWREFEIAAWLHDCGKIVTPEHIVDKGTKLEVIYNRIHEIRLRFEILLRDARIRYWQERAKGRHPLNELDSILLDTQKRLEDEFAFIADCNQGWKAMTPDNLKRLKKIAEQTWERHFDNRLGLSHLEIQDLDQTFQPLPCREKLLSDLPRHRKARETLPNAPSGKPDFKIPIPELLYNHGELYNLSIEQGTLTPEDRFRIQEHITTTIRMLEILPFPKELSRVPEYAGTHHETLAGDGYPRALAREEISIPGRILAIADIFEALTASDRPYKKAKSLGMAIKIMAGMRDRGHIDPDLFRVFLISGVYLDYAKKFLRSSQVEPVDITPYV